MKSTPAKSAPAIAKTISPKKAVVANKPVVTASAPATSKSANPTKAAKKAAPSHPAPKPPASKAASPVKTASVAPKSAPAVAEEPKPKKPKLVRDSFTIPKAEFAVLEALKQRAVGLHQPARKSELLRAGIKALAAMGDEAFKAALAAVPAIKTGRPGKAK